MWLVERQAYRWFCLESLSIPCSKLSVQVCFLYCLNLQFKRWKHGIFTSLGAFWLPAALFSLLYFRIEFSIPYLALDWNSRISENNGSYEKEEQSVKIVTCLLVQCKQASHLPRSFQLVIFTLFLFLVSNVLKGVEASIYLRFRSQP